MRPGTVALAFAFIAALATACGGSSTGKNAGQTLKELHDPKSAPTAALGGTPATPLPANGSIAGSASGAQPDTYVVKSGDTLGTIASSLGVSVDDLARTNGITDPSRLQIGQQLKVPRPGASPTPAAAATRPSLSTPGPGATVGVGGQVPPTGGAPSGVPIAGSSPGPAGTPGTAATAPSSSATAASTASASTPSASGAATEYTVKAGDSACAIAIANGISLQELANANGQSKEQMQRLSIGQLLKIPPRTGNKGC